MSSVATIIKPSSSSQTTSKPRPLRKLIFADGSISSNMGIPVSMVGISFAIRSVRLFFQKRDSSFVRCFIYSPWQTRLILFSFVLVDNGAYPRNLGFPDETIESCK